MEEYAFTKRKIEFKIKNDLWLSINDLILLLVKLNHAILKAINYARILNFNIHRYIFIFDITRCLLATDYNI